MESLTGGAGPSYKADVLADAAPDVGVVVFVNGPHAAASVIFLCDGVGGERRLSHEVTDLAWRHLDDIECWHGDHERFARRALIAHRARSRII